MGRIARVPRALFGVVVLATVVGSAAFFLFALDPLISLVLRRTGVLRPAPDGAAG